MKKLLLILITAVVGLVAHADMTIYYDNSNTGWTTCKITYWKTGDNGWSYNKKRHDCSLRSYQHLEVFCS